MHLLGRPDSMSASRRVAMLCRFVKKRGYCATVVIASFALLALSLPAPVDASGIGISGSFQQHYYKMVPGETVETPDIYIVVFNQEDTATRIKLTPQSPPGVEIRLTESDFLIPAGKEHKVEVGVVVGLNAVPGEYTLAITAEIQRTAGAGITVMGAVQQQTKLIILGEAGTIRIKTVDFAGNPLSAELRVCLKEDALIPCLFSLTGELEARVVPGVYVAKVFYQDIEIATQEFTLEAGKTSDITLVGQTVFIRGFSVVPNYYTDQGDIAFVNVVYTLENIYQPLLSSKATLKVAFNGRLLEEEQIISLPTLAKGSTDGNYKYVPTKGWQNGIYTFSMSLSSQGKFAAQSTEQKLEVSKASAQAPAGTNWLLIGIIIGVLLIIIIILLATRRHRKL